MKSFSLAILLIGYVVVMASGLWGLHCAHDWAIASYDSTEVEGKQRQADWDQWRKEAAEQRDGKGPVSRRVPKSAEPPTLVLMRDHYGICVTAFLLFGSVLYGTFVIMVRGMLSSPGKFSTDP